MCWVMPPASPDCDVRLADPVKKGRLAVVDVAHHRYYGRLLDQVGRVIIRSDLDRLGLLDRADLHLDAEFLGDQFDLLGRKGLRERLHLPQAHQEP